MVLQCQSDDADLSVLRIWHRIRACDSRVLLELLLPALELQIRALIMLSSAACSSLQLAVLLTAPVRSTALKMKTGVKRVKGRQN
jgi:hypothetical protein